ncbi:DUF937 domain-containing protein [Prosthecodimorpha staleyi]|uniref:DUF937 domain-containing protein n=1 Tax=Prosthecodimorpha staleyi TaxID=2840188 RepID=A0A947D326_9HYPH|nr:DUF937 domain-containing protein [Prosthecodimorpha staleyi]MBT9289389.1 DUF937 domain-containing protein [Prosthecodimorpha staleyi]
MFDFTKILLEAQGGEAMRNLARQFGISPDQSRAAVDAMMPAFAAAMQRQMTDPKALQALFGLMTGQAAQPRNPYLDAMQAFTPEAMKAGNDALMAMFGSNEVTKAVADRIAAMSGVGQQVLQSMMPAVAAMLMGGLGTSLPQDPVARMVAAFFDPARAQDSYAGFGDMMQKWMRDGAANGTEAFASLVQQFAKAVPRPTGETETMEDFLKRAPNPAGPQTLMEEAFGAFVRGFNRGRPEKKPEPEAAPDELGAFIGQMFQAGQEAQASQIQAFEQIFDQFWSQKR